MERVSVIITTYRRNEHLKRAINSVLKQSYKNIEIIVVDDNDSESEDRKRNIKYFEKNSKGIKYIKHSKNLNGAAARNTGIKNATGKYITFLDDDDEFLSDRIEIIIDKMKSENLDVVYSNLIIKTYNNEKILYVNKKGFSGNIKKELLLRKLDIGSGSNLVIKKEIIEEIGLFDVEFKRHQDWEFLIRVLRKYKITYIDKILLVKNMDSRINFPDSYILEEVKALFYFKFKKDIEEMSEKEQKEFFDINNKELLNSYINDLRLKKAINTFMKINEVRIKDIKKISYILIKTSVKKVMKK